MNHYSRMMDVITRQVIVSPAITSSSTQRGDVLSRALCWVLLCRSQGGQGATSGMDAGLG
jgi:hypothetical protein